MDVKQHNNNNVTAVLFVIFCSGILFLHGAGKVQSFAELLSIGLLMVKFGKIDLSNVLSWYLFVLMASVTVIYGTFDPFAHSSLKTDVLFV